MKLGHRLCDAGSFAIPLVVYIASASHEPGSWDTAELQGVPYILGITHPTGFPLYVLIGYAWSHVVALDTIAFRMNVMSAVAMAIAASAAYALALRIGAWRPIALAATLWFAFAHDVWSHANRAEAQDLAVLCEALAIYAFVAWMKGDGARWFVAAWALLGLGIAAHPNALWLLIGFIAGTAIAQPRASQRSLGLSAGCFAAALLLYAYLPLRSAYIVAHHLDPTAALPGSGGGIFWNYNNPSTSHGLRAALTGSESAAPQYLLASLDPLRVPDVAAAFVTGITAQFGALALMFAVIGAVAAWKRDWRTTLVLVLCCTAALFFSVTYATEADVGRYRIMSLWLMVPLLAALAPGAPTNARSAIVRLLLAAACFTQAGASLWNQRDFFSHAPGEGGRWVISAVAPHVAPGGAIVVAGWLDATSLAYGAYADGSLPGRIIVSGWHPEMSGIYSVWAKQRPVFILADPHGVREIAGTKPPILLDAYHELFQVR